MISAPLDIALFKKHCIKIPENSENYNRGNHGIWPFRKWKTCLSNLECKSVTFETDEHDTKSGLSGSPIRDDY